MNTEKQVALKDGTELVSVETEHGTELAVTDGGPCITGLLWLWSDNAYGWPQGVVIADSFEDAYYAAADALEPIDDADLPDAYGVTHERLQEERAAQTAGHEWTLDLQGGYHYQDHPKGTGVANTEYLSIRPLTHEDARERLQLTVRAY